MQHTKLTERMWNQDPTCLRNAIWNAIFMGGTKKGPEVGLCAVVEDVLFAAKKSAAKMVAVKMGAVVI
ncbi:hypothetical protein U1Q18_025572 [Sarracenia purpurea var. burkii]